MTSNDESPLADTEVHYLRSDHVGDEFKILVGHCGPPEGDRGVVFVSDENFQFGTALNIAELLSMVGDLPQLLVVGIGYRVKDTSSVRSRDFTPVVYPRESSIDPTMMGGAAGFVGFLRDELKPWVEQRYTVDVNESAFLGHSLGGLFATYALLTEPALFKRYGIGSPAYWWGDGVMFEQEATYAQAHDDLPAKVFFSVGEYETPDGDQRRLNWLPDDKRAEAQAEAAAEADIFGPVNMVADTERMVTALRSRGYAGLDIGYEVLAGEYHPTAVPINLSRSLRYLFNAPR